MMAVLKELLAHAAIFISAVAGAVGLAALASGIVKQRRENKIGRAKFGYELIDGIFSHQKILPLLEAIDGKPQFLFDVRSAIQPNVSNPCEEYVQITDALDWLLLHFDRVEHAISADLTRFEVIEMPLAYYVNQFGKIKDDLLRYIDGIGYSRVRVFLNRFKGWREPRSH